jgi:hypothetical protein
MKDSGERGFTKAMASITGITFSLQTDRSWFDFFLTCFLRRADGNKYEGFWRGGHRDGYGVRTWPDGDVFEGDWVAGKRTGKGTYSWPNGTPTHGHALRSSNPQGVVAQFPLCGVITSGSRYEGEWNNGCHHGYGVYTWLDGRRYEGQWDYNKKQGVGTYYFGSEGCAYTGHWEDGYRHGQGTHSGLFVIIPFALS